MSKRYSTGWITLKGTSSYAAIEQPEQDWFDCTGYDYAQVTLILSELDSCTLNLMTGEKGNQYFNGILSLTGLSVTAKDYYLSREVPPGDSNHLSDLMKWTIDGGANWQTTFRIVVNLKK